MEVSETLTDDSWRFILKRLKISWFARFGPRTSLERRRNTNLNFFEGNQSYIYVHYDGNDDGVTGRFSLSIIPSYG